MESSILIFGFLIPGLMMVILTAIITRGEKDTPTPSKLIDIAADKYIKDGLTKLKK